MTWLYLDTKNLPTTGLGWRVVDLDSMLALPWMKNGALASEADKRAEWARVNARTDLSPRSGWAFEPVAQLRLPDSVVDELAAQTTAEFWAKFVALWPNAETWPADAQLAALDLAWQNGPAFTSLRQPNGSWTWPNMRAAFTAEDWNAAADAVPGQDNDEGDRADARVQLFRNAAKVKTLALDPDKLWNTTTPTAPPPTAPPEDPPMYSKQWNIDYVRWRNGNVALVSRDVCLAIPSPVYLSQGGLSFAGESANTHAGIGAYDISVKGWSKSKVNALCSELIRSGEVAFPRGGLWGTGFFVQHVHVVSANVPRSALHPEARAQLDAYKRGRNGLTGRSEGKYVGPKVPLGTWASSPYNPKNVREVTGRMVVVAGKLLGNTVDRKQVETKRKGDGISYVRQVYRWGRWNVVTVRGTYFAISDKSQTYLEPVVTPPPPPVDPPPVIIDPPVEETP